MNSSQRRIYCAAGYLRTKTLSMKAAVIAADLQPALHLSYSHLTSTLC